MRDCKDGTGLPFDHFGLCLKFDMLTACQEIKIIVSVERTKKHLAKKYNYNDQGERYPYIGERTRQLTSYKSVDNSSHHLHMIL